MDPIVGLIILLLVLAVFLPVLGITLDASLVRLFMGVVVILFIVWLFRAMGYLHG